MHIYTELPGDVPEGTLSTLTIAGTGIWTYDNTITLRAVPPIAAEKDSWGKIKKLFR